MRELGIMTHSSTQTGTVVITVTLGQGTTWNLPRAMETIEFIGVSWGRVTTMPSMATSCTVIGCFVWSLTSCRSQLRLPAPLEIRQISPSGRVIGIVGYWTPLTVKYHTPPV